MADTKISALAAASAAAAANELAINEAGTSKKLTVAQLKTFTSSYTDFTRDLGDARRSGTFDITGLSGLTTDKVVGIVQTAAAIASKGNARDEPEMDLIQLTGYVLNGTTIRAYWWAPAVVVGTYAFAYQIGG